MHNPTLALVPSVYDRQAWTVATLSILDAGALAISSLEIGTVSAARICVQAGETALQKLSASMPYSGLDDEKYATALEVEWATFATMLERLSVAGAPVRLERDAAWLEFRKIREGYSTAVARIANATLLPAEMLHVSRVTNRPPSGFD